MPTEPVQPDPSWNDTEKFIWTCAVKGEVADLNKRDGFVCPVDDPTKWPESRTVSSAFLETILTEEKWKEAVHPHGVRIVGVHFVEQINLGCRRIPFPLWIAISRLDWKFSAENLIVEGDVSFQGSFFVAPLSLQGSALSKNLLLGRATFHQVELRYARIGAACDLTRVTVHGKLDMNGIQAEGGLFMREGSNFREVNLVGARIGGTCDLNGSQVTGTLQMDGAQIAGPLFLGKCANFQKVVLRGTRVKGHIALDGSMVNGSLIMEWLDVEGDCLAFDLKLQGLLEAPRAFFQGSLDFTNASFAPAKDVMASSVDLSGSTIGGELHFWQPGAPPVVWDRMALILRNVSCGALQDHPDGWPEVLDLTGLTYDRLGGLGGGSKGSIAHRSKGWIFGWLRRQADGETLLAYRNSTPLPEKVDERDRFAPQPYEQLASVLEKEGMRELAKGVHIEKMERFREIATGRDWLWLTVIKYLINYGYSNWRPLLWALLIFYVGWVLALAYSFADPAFTFDPLSFSLDMLLPVVHLYEPHYSFNFTRWFFRWWFHFEQITGYVLALFVAAGLTGLTKR